MFLIVVGIVSESFISFFGKKHNHKSPHAHNDNEYSESDSLLWRLLLLQINHTSCFMDLTRSPILMSFLKRRHIPNMGNTSFAIFS
jgi:hypothetical protein